MDFDRILDIEVFSNSAVVISLPLIKVTKQKRTGVKNSDIDDFVERATAIESLVKGLKEGTIDPDAMPRIKGIDTAEEQEEKEVHAPSPFSIVGHVDLC